MKAFVCGGENLGLFRIGKNSKADFGEIGGGGRITLPVFHFVLGIFCGFLPLADVLIGMDFVGLAEVSSRPSREGRSSKDWRLSV